MPRPNPQVVPLADIREIQTVQGGSGPQGTLVDTTYTGASVGVYQYYRTYSSSNTPGFKGKRRRQKLPFHSHAVSGLEVSGSVGFTNTVDNTGSEPVHYGHSWSNSAAMSPARPSTYGDTASALAKYTAVKRLANSINDVRFNAGIAFAERKQTAELIASTASRIANAAIALKRGNLSHMFSVLGMSSRATASEVSRVLRTPLSKRLANHWNEYSFGWVPLLNDVTGAAETLASHAIGDFFHTEARASAKNELQRTWQPVNPGPTYSMFEVSRCKYVVHYRLDSYSRAALGSTGINNPLSILWEIVPYSFVVDWFIDVSGYLKTLMQFDGFELVDGSISTKWDAKMIKILNSHSEGSWGSVTTGGTCNFHEWQFQRDPIVAFPSQALPSFRNPLDKGPLWKTITSIALLRQLFK